MLLRNKSLEREKEEMGKQNVTGKCVGNDGVKKMDIHLSARQRE